MSTEPVWYSIVFFSLVSSLLLLQIALGAVKPPCKMCVQYIGGYNKYIGGYHEYIGGCSVPLRDTMMHVGGYFEYSGRYSVHRRVTMMHVRDIMIRVRRYHE